MNWVIFSDLSFVRGYDSIGKLSFSLSLKKNKNEKGVIDVVQNCHRKPLLRHEQSLRQLTS